MTNAIFHIVVVVAVLIAAWWIASEFSPNALLTKLVQLAIFLIAIYVVLTMVLPLAGVSF